MDAKWFRNSFIWLIVMVFVLAIAFQVFHNQSTPTKSVSMTGPTSIVSVLQADLANGTNVILTQDGNTVTLEEPSKQRKFQATISDRLDVTTALKDSGFRLASANFEKY